MALSIERECAARRRCMEGGRWRCARRVTMYSCRWRWPRASPWFLPAPPLSPSPSFDSQRALPLFPFFITAFRTYLTRTDVYLHSRPLARAHSRGTPARERYRLVSRPSACTARRYWEWGVVCAGIALKDTLLSRRTLCTCVSLPPLLSSLFLFLPVFRLSLFSTFTHP
ncbi:hypothetical protein B0H13DRAFT_104814 [Mycena leptocephala]|nr:hypothetical protein B0H13DRAFT_104814 [Mycena leptocephala]